MGVIKKKPYEISVWEDRLVTEKKISYYKEMKLAVIGSDKMDSPNRAFDPVLTENINGEKTLTFSLVYKYYDEYTGEMVINPFHKYLINERKIKLFYNDEWFDFIIKECNEDSVENIFKYTARDSFSLELAKLGYNVTLDPSLNNNQGTIIELAKQVLQDTDWKVDEENSDLLVQFVQEPLYKATTLRNISVLNLDTNQQVSIESGEIIYIFYSFITNKIVDYVQFIREADRDNFFIDDDNVIKSTNYRITSPVNYIIDSQTQQITELEGIASIDEFYFNNQGYRLVYKNKTTYDPVMERTVDLYQMPYKGGIKEIYHFLDYNYATSDLVTSYITNGSNFQLYEDGKLQGWYNTTPVTSDDAGAPVLQPINITTYPQLDSHSALTLVENLSELNGYLEFKFNNVLTNDFENTLFNQGFEHNRSIIDHISQGEEFVLRTRYYLANEQHGELVAGNPTGTNKGLRLIVAKYETINQECYTSQESKDAGGSPSTIKSYKILPDDIILDFNGNFTKSPNLITGGVFDKHHKQYLIDKVIQVPSTSYIYKTDGDDTEYIWDTTQKIYVPKTSATQPFADYYLTTARAQYSFTNEQMSDPGFKMGIFLYTKDNNLVNHYVYLEDIQLTRCYRDGNNDIITLGNIPTAVSLEAHHYYLKPDPQRTKKEITTYGSLEFLAKELGVKRKIITPMFNEKSEKVLSIQVSNSNYFNILQNLCETFECWLDIRVQHEEDGSITLDSNFNPIKKVAFKEYIGKDNFAGFKNGVNLKGITRNIDSSEIVTKLIVDPVQSEYSTTGLVDIQNAQSNPSGQSYILNFSYYLNRGLITDIEQCNKDVNAYNQKIKKLNDKRRQIESEYLQASNALTKIAAQRATYTALIEEAEQQYNEALEEFQQLTNWEYDAFITEYQNIEDWAVQEKNHGKNYLENDTILEVVGKIYASSVTLNNYSGILTNLNQTYQDLSLKCYGAKEYNVSVAFIPAVEEVNPSVQVVIEDYISGLYFQLIDDEGNFVSYHTSPNDRIFNISNAVPYQFIRFLQLPSNYNLRFFQQNGKEVVLNKKQIGEYFQIYDDITGDVYNRQFTLVPTQKYLKAHKGFQNEINELIEQRQAIEKDFYKKYSRFLQEGTWSSQDYIDSELYYFDALQVSNTSAQPKVNYTIDVLEISQIDDFESYDFRVGDKTYIEDTDFFGYIYQSVDVDSTGSNPTIITTRSPVREEVVVSEVEWHFDEPNNNIITVQNYKTQFEDLFQRVSATVQTVQRNEITYPKTNSILDQSGLINSNLLANSLNGIGGVGFNLTTNGSVMATNDGLLIRDLLNPANVMKLTSLGIQVSTDSGANWSTAINAAGISTDVLTAGTINTQRIWLMDGSNPSFRWDKAGLNAYGLDERGNNSYNLKTYVRFDKYGLYGIKNGEDYVAKSLQDVRNKAFFGITWDGFFIKNSYTNGEVSITSDDDFLIKQNGINRIKIGAIEKNRTGTPIRYGINIMNNNGDVVFDTGDDGNITISGTINAQAGQYSGVVSVGNPNSTHIIIDGESENPTISSSNYSDGAGTGWIIDSNGDATFSNVSVRGAIKTAVFEYEEIQAVGGAFLFRPASTIVTARYIPTEVTEEDEEGELVTFETYYHYDETTGDKIYNDLIVTVEKPLMFRKNNWVKISNYNQLGVDPAADLTTYGLVHIYEVSDVDFTPHPSEPIIIIDEDGNEQTIEVEPTEPSYELTLAGGCAILDSFTIDNVPGGALIDFGGYAQKEGIDVPAAHNYGIGINSSDNYVNLPARAISLFETTIHPNNTTKVTYDYRGILGTLPALQYTGSSAQVNPLYHDYLEGTQGIYTDNMYLGDKDQFLTFYTDRSDPQNPKKKLRIRANQVMFEVYDKETGEPTGEYHDINDVEAEGVPGPQGESAITVNIESNIGNNFIFGNREAILSCYVYEGTDDITSTVQTFTWTKVDRDGDPVQGWVPKKQGIEDGLLKNQIMIDTEDVDMKSIFYCNVLFD